MKKFNLPARLILGTLLIVGFIAPLHALPQDTSTASLADTLSWLVSFLPTHTGTGNTVSGSVSTSRIELEGGCNVRLHSDSVIYDGGKVVENWSLTWDFSLADLDPASLYERTNTATGFIQLVGATRGGAQVMRAVSSDTLHANPTNYQSSGFTLSYFLDSSSADRAVNAFRHAADLCANSQPF